MKLTIIKINQEVVTCELEDGTLLDIAKRWFEKDIKINDVLEFDINNC